MDTTFFHIVLKYNPSPHTTREIAPDLRTFEMDYACVARAASHEKGMQIYHIELIYFFYLGEKKRFYN